jgi:hypothetical protein
MRRLVPSVFLAACAANGDPSAQPPGSSSAASQGSVVVAQAIACVAFDPVEKGGKKGPIGTVKMEADGTLVLDIRSPAMTLQKYDPKHAEYASVKKHVGPIKPGESKALAPWPDAVDDAKVEESICAWAQKQKDWGAGPMRWQIMGTSVDDGTISVSTWTETKRRSVVLDPKTYAVKSATDR